MELLHGLGDVSGKTLHAIGSGLSFLAVKTVRVRVTSTAPCLRADARALFITLPQEATVGVALHGRDGALLSARRPTRDCHVHCDVVQARGLLPSGSGERDSDPQVEAQLLLREADEDGQVTPNTRHARQRGATSKTAVRLSTLHPIYEEELVLVAVEGAYAVRFYVHDGGDGLLGNASLGYCDVPLPPRPLPLERRRPPPPAPPVQGWYPLTAPPAQLAQLAPLLAKLGRTGSVNPLGELYVRVSWGAGVRTEHVNHRPTLRCRLGRLFLAVHAAEGLPPIAADRPAVVAKLEHQVGVTPHREGTTDPVWPVTGEDAQFIFAVTEITSDLVLSVVSMDAVLGVQTVGEVIVPMATLVGARPRTLWSAILPPRGPGESVLRPHDKPRVPLGRLRFSIFLEMETSVPFAYLCPDVPKRECAHGEDQSGAFSIEALHGSLGRVLDCALAPMFSPLRTILYLQTWQAPMLNLFLMYWLIVITRPECWRYTVLCTPLWALVLPFLHGLVSSYIHARDPTHLYTEEAAAVKAAAAAVDEAAQTRHAKMVALRNEMLERLTKRDPSLAQHRLEFIPGGAAVSQLGNVLGGAVKKTAGDAAANADQLNFIKTINTKLQGLHTQLLAAAAPAERLRGALDWTDPNLTWVLFRLAVALGVALSLLLAGAVWLADAVGLNCRTATLLWGLACLAPPFAPLSYGVLASIDDALASLRGVAYMTPLLGGAGLAAAAPRGGALQDEGEEMKAVIAEAKAFVDKQEHKRQEELAARGTLRHASLISLGDMLSGAWVSRLIKRAPDVPRKHHLRMIQRAKAPKGM